MRAAGRYVGYPARALAWFVLLALAGGALGYGSAFRATANAFLTTMAHDRVARLEPFTDPEGVADTKLSVGRRIEGAPRYASNLKINLVREAWTPTALAAALVLALPIPWLRRLAPLAIAVGICQAFAGLRIAVATLHGLSRIGYGEHRLLEVGTLGSRALHRADQILTGDLHLTYVLPLALGFLVAVKARVFSTTWFDKEG